MNLAENLDQKNFTDQLIYTTPRNNQMQEITMNNMLGDINNNFNIYLPQMVSNSSEFRNNVMLTENVKSKNKAH